ncbi:ATP-binding protein [Geodermatophilus sp. SYSU D00804]
MSVEALSFMVAKAVAPALIGRLAGAALPEERVSRWMGRDPVRLALQEALREALTDFQSRYPRASDSFFDDVFLTSAPVATLLARCAPPGPPPQPSELAGLYVDQLGPATDRDAAVRRETPMAADFLATFREHLRHKAAFRPLFDSADTDVMTASLREVLERLPDLLTGLNQAPERLRLHIKPVTTFREQRTAFFVGREFVLDAIDEKLLSLPSGYVLVHGEPGIGKSAIMAELVRTRDYVHHFNVATGGIRTADQCLRNLCAQLIVRYELPYTELPPDAGRDAGFLDVVLRDAVSAATARDDLPVVVVVDALDEAEEPSGGEYKAGVNRLKLPATLPDGVVVVASIRAGVPDLLTVDRRAKPIEIDEDDPRNFADVRTYVETFIDREAEQIRPRLPEWKKTEAQLADDIVAHSEGNFLYVVSLLEGIATGSVTAKNFGGLEGLPTGLMGYYDRHWRAMRDVDVRRFERVQRPVVCMLAVAPGAVTAEKVAEWISESHVFEPVSVREVDHVLDEWRQFFNPEPGDPPRWRLYHTSFQKFLAERAEDVDLAQYRAASVAATGAKIRWDA